MLIYIRLNWAEGGRSETQLHQPVQRTGHNNTITLVTPATQEDVKLLSAVGEDSTTLTAPLDANRSEQAPLKPSMPVTEDGYGNRLRGPVTTGYGDLWDSHAENLFCYLQGRVTARVNQYMTFFPTISFVLMICFEQNLAWWYTIIS